MPTPITRGALSAKGFGFTNGGGKADLYINGAIQTTNIYLSYPGSNNPYLLTVTGGPLTMTVYLWGASGGSNDYSATYYSGAGGGSVGTVTLSPGTNYYLYVGQGGQTTSATDGSGGSGGWPNGGYGTRGDASGAGGGGMSMLSKALYSTSMSTSDIFLIAGAGGGQTGYARNAGAGGGSSGESAAGSVGTGGTQSSGGVFNGSYLMGGRATGSQYTGTDDGGGGGGGYYGGGGGTSDAQPAGGGSGYYNPSLVVSGSTVAGSGSTPPTLGGVLLSGYAAGVSSSGRYTGQNGLAYLQFV